ncbi:menaquinone reductase integral membrane subunit QrcD [Desulfocurvus sp. DL9XJH121]
MDRAFWPEGVERCSFGKFLLWLGFIGIFLALGLYEALMILIPDGLARTALDNYFGFGLWITFDLGVIALGAGAFFTGLLKYILDIKELEKIVNLTVIVGFICYSGAMLVLALDVGQPLRSWFGFWHPNVHSMLTEVMFCITCYLMVLTLEFVPNILENRKLNEIPILHNIAHNFHYVMPLIAGIGAFLSTFHQGSLGGMYGVLFARPYILRDGFFIWPWTFFLFVLSAVASGPCFSVLVVKLMELLTGKQLVDYNIKKLMCRIGGTMLALYMFFKFLDTWAWYKDVLPRSGLTWDQMFNSGLGYGEGLLWAELFLCGVIPAILLLTPRFRNNPALLYTAAILNCCGVIINRYVFTVQALAIPVMPFDQWYSYAPNWAEWAPSIAIIAYGFLILSLAYRYLPVFPQEVELNNYGAAPAAPAAPAEPEEASAPDTDAEPETA